MAKNVLDVGLASKVNNEDGVLINASTQDLVLLLNVQFAKRHTNEKIHQDIVQMNVRKLKQSLK
jgi:hypothetical protein